MNAIYYSIHKYFFMHNFRLQNLKFKHLIDVITINDLFSENSAKMNNIKRKYYPIINFLKFTSTKKILCETVSICYKLVLLAI